MPGYNETLLSGTAGRRHSIRPLALAIAIALPWGPASTAAPASRTIAVFNFELIDTSLEGSMNGPRADEQTRLAEVSNRLRQRLTETGKFTLADISSVAAEAHASNLQSCGGCDVRLARKVGAELALTGTVQKVSNLILNMNMYVRDTGTGQIVAAGSADMRGNTDESWSRTLDWLLRNRLLADGALK